MKDRRLSLMQGLLVNDGFCSRNSMVAGREQETALLFRYSMRYGRENTG